MQHNQAREDMRDEVLGLAFLVFLGLQGFQGHGLSILRIRYLVPRTCFCDAFSSSAILRVEGCLNNTLQQHSPNPLGLALWALDTLSDTVDPEEMLVAVTRGSHLSNTTCLTHAFFKSGEECSEFD